MAGESYAAGGIRTTVAATRAATDEQLAAQRRAARRRDAPAGHHHRRDQERLRADRPRRGAQPGDRPAVHRRDHVPRCARRAARSTPTTRPATSSSSPARCSTPPRRTPAGSTCSARRGAFDADQARTILAAGQAKGLGGRLHANQLGPGPGVRLACELGLTAVDHCTFLDDADVAALADSGTVATLLPGVEFSTRSPYPDARAPPRRRRHGGARQRLQPRLLLHLLDAAVRRAGRPRDADDPGRGGLVGHGRRGARARPRRRRRARARASAPT